jgi:hypothetical protein
MTRTWAQRGWECYPRFALCFPNRTHSWQQDVCPRAVKMVLRLFKLAYLQFNPHYGLDISLTAAASNVFQESSCPRNRGRCRNHNHTNRLGTNPVLKNRKGDVEILKGVDTNVSCKRCRSESVGHALRAIGSLNEIGRRNTGRRIILVSKARLRCARDAPERQQRNKRALKNRCRHVWSPPG